MEEIKIIIGEYEFMAELYPTETAKIIYDNCPLSGNITKWGNEMYFSIPVAIQLEESAQEELEEGELAFWPTGNAFCVFFGITPASTGPKPKAVSPVNVFGKIKGDVRILQHVNDTKIRVEKVKS